MTIPRLYIDAPLAAGPLTLGGDQAHYLVNVLRKDAGAPLMLFNGRDGEWRGVIASAGKKSCTVDVAEQTRAQQASPDLWLLFAPVKHARIDFIAEKATELGVARLRPVITARTNVARVNLDRLRANAVEAAEQTERLDIPQVDEPVPLFDLLRDWPADRLLLFCDETGGTPAATSLSAVPRFTPSAVLIGPEGGFTADEAARIRSVPRARAVSLGPRILRADTAALAMLSLWQALAGDGEVPPPPFRP